MAALRAVPAGLVMLLLSGCSGEKQAEYEARDVCEQFVKDQLKAPGSADFSDTSASESGGQWTVTGSVDSENGFGALIRNTYTCVVEHKDGDTWSLVSLDSTEN